MPREMNSLRPMDAKTAVRDFTNSRGDGPDGAILLMFDMNFGKLAASSWGRRITDRAAMKEVLDEIMDMLFTGEISVGLPGDEPVTNCSDGSDMIG